MSEWLGGGYAVSIFTSRTIVQLIQSSPICRLLPLARGGAYPGPSTGLNVNSPANISLLFLLPRELSGQYVLPGKTWDTGAEQRVDQGLAGRGRLWAWRNRHTTQIWILHDTRQTRPKDSCFQLQLRVRVEHIDFIMPRLNNKSVMNFLINVLMFTDLN